SPYLREVRTVLPDAPAMQAGEDEDADTAPPTPEGGDAGTAMSAAGLPTERGPWPVRRHTYTVHELSHHALCPRRYALERIDPRAALYTDAFHVRLLAEAAWHDAAYRALEQDGPFANGS